MAKQSARFELFNYLFKAFSNTGVPVVRLKELEQELPYPFIVLETVEDSIDVLSFDNYGGDPAVRAHIWNIEDDLASTDELYIKTQEILFNAEMLPSYRVTLENIDINDTTDTTTNQTLQHIIIDASYRAS
ncbi:hypothetical protein ISO99_06815 [Staphylococcus sp. 18_1_E_LY]|uniref:DUF3168 domain-containing protein n=1 Tax=Staphylococcus lloydii TaxID=2781774 RepID=A0A7T1AZK4_9STAP|nr:hypothetical protein [Staphylococcus lloydii]MBF7019622.1 hypothetical protein [Staphylococcus lloydii]MBF7027350.1 hypothetical protein [Staphylococcus lloydii]MDU9419016.1 hypothetical protein [Staphylococcus lloydii]QPM75014.1 hypothetical protein ISP08_11950 [Staphylococcus lloydii]